MANIQLTQQEAERLLSMIKRTLKAEINFPKQGDKLLFQVQGESSRDNFTIQIYRGSINRLKYELGARITKNGISLLELHINPSGKHQNPDGTVIIGSHWHIYTEKYGRKMAFPAEDISDDLFVETTVLFLKKFNVIERPNIKFQLELT